MARARKRPDSPAAELEMTPMIDVVFQLLIYFIVTIKPIDVVTNLDVFRPAPDKNAKKDEEAGRREVSQKEPSKKSKKK